MKNYKQNEVLEATDSVFKEIHDLKDSYQNYYEELQDIRTGKAKARAILSEITEKEVDESVDLNLPIYTDFGANIDFGKNIFVNTGVMFTDLGGIKLEDNVLIGPFAKLLTVNHSTNPSQRRGLILKKIHIKENAWIGAGATILPGVTVGKNAIVSAGAVVTKDVPDNVIVAGVPAKIIKEIEE